MKRERVSLPPCRHLRSKDPTGIETVMLSKEYLPLRLPLFIATFPLGSRLKDESHPLRHFIGQF